MNRNTIKIMLFASMIAVMIVSFSATSMIEAQPDNLVRDYEKIDKLGKTGYEIHLKIENSTNSRVKEQLSTQFDNVLRQLEYYGITTIEKAESDPYWAIRSSQHQNGELNYLPPVANFLLPVAYAVDSPDFQLGYEHDFWEIFSWHQWTGDWISIEEFHSDDDSIMLQDDYLWIKAKWQVRATNIVLDHIYDYQLKDGNLVKHSEYDAENTLHNGIGVVRVISTDRYNNSPEENWTITVDWTVQAINDWP